LDKLYNSNGTGGFGRAYIHNTDLVISGTNFGGTSDQMVTKIDSSGQILWQNVRSPGSDHDSYSSVNLVDNKYLFYGTQNAQGSSYFDGTWAFFDQNGNEISYFNENISGSTYGTDSKTLLNGNVVSGGKHSNSPFISLYDNSLNLIAQDIFTIGASDVGCQIEIDNTNQYIFAIAASRNSTGVHVRKYDFSLNLISSNSYFNSIPQIVYDVVFENNNLYLSGYRYENNLSTAFIYKIDDNDNLVDNFLDSQNTRYTSIETYNGDLVVAKSFMSEIILTKMKY